MSDFDDIAPGGELGKEVSGNEIGPDHNSLSSSLNESLGVNSDQIVELQHNLQDRIGHVLNPDTLRNNTHNLSRNDFKHYALEPFSKLSGQEKEDLLEGYFANLAAANLVTTGLRGIDISNAVALINAKDAIIKSGNELQQGFNQKQFEQSIKELENRFSPTEVKGKDQWLSSNGRLENEMTVAAPGYHRLGPMAVNNILKAFPSSVTDSTSPLHEALTNSKDHLKFIPFNKNWFHDKDIPRT